MPEQENVATALYEMKKKKYYLLHVLSFSNNVAFEIHFWRNPWIMKIYVLEHLKIAF